MVNKLIKNMNMSNLTKIYKEYRMPLFLLLITILCVVLYIRLYKNNTLSIEGFGEGDTEMELDLSSVVTQANLEEKINEKLNDSETGDLKFYTRNEVDDKITGINDIFYTKNEVDDRLTSINDKFYTKTDIDDTFYTKTDIDENYLNKQFLNTYDNELGQYIKDIHDKDTELKLMDEYENNATMTDNEINSGEINNKKTIITSKILDSNKKVKKRNIRKFISFKTVDNWRGSLVDKDRINKVFKKITDAYQKHYNENKDTLDNNVDGKMDAFNEAIDRNVSLTNPLIKFLFELTNAKTPVLNKILSLSGTLNYGGINIDKSGIYKKHVNNIIRYLMDVFNKDTFSVDPNNYDINILGASINTLKLDGRRNKYSDKTGNIYYIIIEHGKQEYNYEDKKIKKLI